MEEPGTCPFESPGRETVGGEGSADLERLLQTAEAENLQMVKLIDTERQKATAFQNQIEDTVAQTEALEESTKRLDAEAKQLHNKFKQNREICEGLRKTATVLDEHEEALRKKLEMVTLQQQTQNLEQGKVMEKYEKTWESYFKKYESMPLAKELSQIKQTAINSEICVKEATEQISKIQAKIIEMEVEKTHMQEYLKENPDTATDSIIKIAKLFLDVEKSSTTARQKVTELKNIHAQLSATKKPTKPPKTGVEHQDAENTMTVEKQSEDCQGDSGDTTQAEEIQHDQQQGVSRRVSLTENQAMYNRQQLDASSTPNTATPTRENLTPRQILTFNQIPLIQQHQRAEIEKATECLPEDSTPTAGNEGRKNGMPEISTPLVSPSHPQKEQRECLSEGTSDSATPQDVVPPVSDTPTTPGGSTPANQSASGTPVLQSTVQSPLDFSQHRNFIRQVTKSPGEGFLYRGRSMYNTNQTQSSDQGGQPTTQQKEPEIIYEAPLNDQPDISLNFFQPFAQRTEGTNQNLFQTNAQPSPDRPRNMFMQASPAKSASSPRQSFSFGPGASSPGRNDSNFLSSNNGMFGRNNTPTDNDSFGSGFALFGSNDSPNTSAGGSSGGFSFSFGGSKSPSKPSGNSGFCLF